VGPVKSNGAVEAMATCSIRSISRLNSALRVSIPDLRNDSTLRSVEARREPVVLRQVEIDDRAASRPAIVPATRRRRLDEPLRNVA